MYISLNDHVEGSAGPKGRGNDGCIDVRVIAIIYIYIYICGTQRKGETTGGWMCACVRAIIHYKISIIIYYIIMYVRVHN
jgi:hypothetical protein